MKKIKRIWLTVLLAAAAMLVGAFAAACDGGKSNVTLSFETNCTLSLDPVEAQVGTEYTLPTMARGGWSFEGWYDNEGLQGDALTSVTVPEQNKTYYAKWEQMYLVVFDTDGGTLSQDAAYVKGGANVLEAISSYVPVKDGLTFGGWFFESTGEALGADYTMPNETINLFARYHVAYKAELYTKDLDGEGYTLEKTVDGKDFVNERLTLEAPALEHFVFDGEAEGNVDSLKLQLPAANNVFRFYYNRGIGFTVRYEANAPQGYSASGSTPATAPVYGEAAAAAECGFTVREHRFAGWSTKREGEAEYAAGDSFDLTGDITLYALWERGCTDRLGGSDVIFLPAAEEGVAVLNRGGAEIRGTVEDNTATFTTEDGEKFVAVLSPAMYSFAWKNEAMADTYYNFLGYYVPEDSTVGSVDTTNSLTINDDMTAVWTYSANDQTTTINGVIRAEKDGYSLVENDVVRLSFHLSVVEDGADEIPVFYTVGEEEGEYLRMLPIGEHLYVASPYIYLDGMGGLLYHSESDSPTAGYYDSGEPFQDGSLSGKFYNAVIEGRGGYEELAFLIYESGYALPLWLPRSSVYGTFTSGADVLTLDGYGLRASSASYTVGGTTYKGKYDLNDSEIFGTVVTLHSGSQTFTFRITGADTFETAQPLDVVAEMLRLAAGPDGADLEETYLVTYTTKAQSGTLAEIYLNLDGTVSRAATGYCTAENLGGITLYTFTRTGDFENDLGEYLFFTTTFSYITNDSLTLTDGSSIVVYYVYEHDGTKNYTLYTEKDGDGQIWNNNLGFDGLGTIYVKDGIALEGSFHINGVGFYENQNFATFTYTDDENQDQTLYFLIEENDDGNTYQVADFPSRTLVLCPVTGAEDLDAYSSPYSLILNGVGGAVYAPRGDASVSDTSKLVSGTYEETGTTPFGDKIYTYYPDENTLGVSSFEFVMGFHQDTFYGVDLVVGMYIYHLRDLEGPSGMYRSSYGTLTLDGFCNQAEYVEADGTEHLGTYHYLNATGDAIYFYDPDEGAAYAIDFPETGESFTVRDGMQGTYPLYNDDYTGYASKNYSVTLDGYGGAVLNIGMRETGTGTYTATDVYYVFHFEFALNAGGNASYDIAFASTGSSVIAIVKNVALSGAYLADNLTVLVLDGFGRGTLYNERGVAHAGVYSLIGDAEGAFEYTDGTGGFRFSYSVEDATFVYNTTYFNDPVVYYASDLSSVVYNGMYAIYDGVQYYFNLDGDDVTLLPIDGGAERHVTFPTGSTYEYNSKTYYKYTVGEEMTFANADGEIEIDIDLSFTPNGERDYVAFEVPATFGTASNYDVAIGYDENGALEVCLVYIYDEEYGIYYEYPITLNWNPHGTSTYAFVEEIEETVETYTDAEAEGGSLTFYYYSVAGALLQGRVVGNLSYGEDSEGNPFTFEADLSAMETIAQIPSDIGTLNLSQILFTAQDGELYAVRFFLGSISSEMETERWYTLDSITICKEYVVDDLYLVRTYHFVYTYPEYAEGLAYGDLYDVDLYLITADEGEESEPLFLPPRFYYVAPDASYAAWGVLFSDGSTLGFMIDFTYGDDGSKFPTGADVEMTYYGQYANEEDTYFVEVCYDYNLSMKTFDILGVTALAAKNEEGEWEQIVADFEQNDDGTWSAIAADGVYTFKITLQEGVTGYYAVLEISFAPNPPAPAEGEAAPSESEVGA